MSSKCRQSQPSISLAALAVKTVLIFELDFAISAAWPGFRSLTFNVMLGKGSFCLTLVRIAPWPAYLWCGGWVGLAVAISYVGLASFGAGQLPASLSLLVCMHLTAPLAMEIATSSLRLHAC